MPHERWPTNGELAELIADQFPVGFSGYGIDVGASDGFSVNTTYILEKKYHWTILSVEPNPQFHHDLLRDRTWVEKCACGSVPADNRVFHVNLDNPEAYSSLNPKEAHPSHGSLLRENWTSIRVNVRTIDQLLEKWAFPRLDLLCVDVEGNELDVLKGCDLKKWHPEMVLVESWDEGDLDEYLKQFDYKRVARHAQNDVYMLGVPEEDK